ncbi:GntR family transcriptional regulator [Nocardioides sp. MAH-18]|uniref:GntR family transcriptional regulator n=1 Tax=Nocardioides agri TaxID=2682843 RepID=A0A6L6XLZ6_9ACTN|nr:GntR family transcriptional regulator [Nocardioides sp. CGMCC 1.13656]MBA2953401.1 FadR family transcriptional regulator [Nocardioides sp. CGMCC 1.13656]MVQ48269.1 GntR family transcriptional regulator [Nocardioides sp. MAH-18]
MAEVRRHRSRARGAIFAPLSDVGRAGQVEQRLTEAIRSGVLAEGERLPSEPELAAMLGVAVVTVREALIGVRAQGLVTTSRGRGGGTFVAAGATADEEALAERLGQMSRAELQDRSTHYVLVLAGCAELAAERADASEAESLRSLLPRDDDAVGAWRHADAELWLSIAALTQSARLTREVVRLEADFGMVARIPLGDPAVRVQVRAGHDRLIDAIGAADPDTARHCARTDLQRTLDGVARTQAELHDRNRMPRSAS